MSEGKPDGNGWTKKARNFTITGAALLMLITLVGVLWAGFRKAEVYINLPTRLDRMEVKVDNIDKNVNTLLEREN